MSEQPQGKEFQRLPKNVIPKHYTIKLEPNLQTFVFSGEAIINLNIKEETSKIILNAADLEISKVVLTSLQKQVEPKSISLDSKDGILTLIFDPALPPSNDSALVIEYKGTLNDGLKGFYRSKYRGADGQIRYNAVTQFESSDARRCFPCWDEPAIRATFDISLTVPKNKVALSNMPVRKTTEHGTDENLHTLGFETTPSMSTYLIGIVVGDFDFVEGQTPDGIPVRVYTPPGKKEQGKFALDVATKALPYYTEYFGVPYSLPKLDLIAVADLTIGAMENWGIITFRETYLLIDESNSSATSKQSVGLVVGHEISHLWFGNLVALEWWDHLWLKEGYASFIEFLCVAHLFPEYDIWTQFITETVHAALQLDSLDNSHPIEVKVGHPSEIDEIFDVISYNKGASIIRMLHDYIGVNDFKKGMNIYLTRHQYSNASTNDLWVALQEASGKPVTTVMPTWTSQMGFPLLSIESRQEGPHRILTLTQDKYSANPTNLHSNSIWSIPLTFSTSQNPDSITHEVLMTTKSTEVTLPLLEGQWVKLNRGIVGYYRVKYSKEMIGQFIPAIRDKTLPPLDRLNILDDLFALVKSGQGSTVQVLELLEAYTDEDNYTVWVCICTILRKLNSLISYTDPEGHQQFKLYGQRILGTIVEKIRWDSRENEQHSDTLLRSLVLSSMVSLGHEETIREGKNRFAGHVKGEITIPADLRTVAYKARLSDPPGDKLNESLESMLKLYRESELMEEQERIAQGFSVLKEPILVDKSLHFAISDHVRSQDTCHFMSDIAATKMGRDHAWEFFKQRWELFRDRYIGGLMVSRLLKNLLSNFVTEEKAIEIQDFFRDHPIRGTERAVKQVVENIRVNANWLERDTCKIQAHLKIAN